MRRIVLLLTLFLVLSVVQFAVAEPFVKYTEYKSGEQLDHGRVSCYLQDSKGMLWLGTWIGLCRYDGKEFRYFRYGPNEMPEGDNCPLGSNRIVKMSLDSYENIWCINYDQMLYRFNRKTASFQSMIDLVKEPLPSPIWVDQVFMMRRNRATWAVLNDGTLIRYNESNPADNIVIPGTSGGKSKKVFQVVEDAKSREWILSDQGAMLYGQGVVSSRPFAHFAEKDGYCILATDDGKVAEYMEDGTLREIEFPIDIHSVSDMRKYLYSEIAISSDAGLIVYNCLTRKPRVVTRTRDGRPVRNVRSVYCDSKERLWFYADGDGVYCLPSGDSLAYMFANPDAGHPMKNENGNLNLFLEDVHNFIWVKPTLGDLCYFDESTFTLRNYKECSAAGFELPFTEYNSVFVDSQRNLWVSSHTRMYELYFGLKQFHEIVCNPGTDVRAMLAVDDSHVLCGDREGRILQVDVQTGYRKYLTSSGQWTDRSVNMFSSGVYVLKQDSRNRIWVGTREDGLFCMHPSANGYRIEQYKNNGKEFDLNCNAVYDVYEDECSRLWIATFGGGLNQIEEQPDGKIHFLNKSNQIFNYPSGFEYVRCIIGDGHGRIMAGTNRGLIAFSSHYKNLSALNFNCYRAQDEHERPLLDNMIMKVLCNAEGVFFVCTFCRGMCQVIGEGVEGLQFQPLPNYNFSAGNVIYSGIVANSGRVWTISECGLTCFNLRNNKQWYFNEQDNNVSNAMSESTPVQMPDGKMVIGISGGLLVFQEDALHKSHFAPKIVFTEQEYSKGFFQYRQLINDIDTLVIQPDRRASILHFSSLDLVPSPYVHYAYSVQSEDGGDVRWIRTVEPSVNFMNMPPGQYRLRVRSCNADAVWCDNTRSLVVIVQPTFWERWLKWIIAVVAVAIVVPVLLTQIRKREKKVEEAAKKEIATAKIEMLSRPVDRADQEFIQRLMQLLEAHLSDGNLQVNDLADEMNMSRATFYRRLKQSVDLSPNDFIHQVRMKRSAEMLTTTDRPISQIAYAVGFNNPKYFSKCFRQDYGVSPVDYRAKSRGESVGVEGE